MKVIRQELTYRDAEESIDNIWSILYSTGYLTQRGRLPGKQKKLALPNREVKELFIDFHLLMKDLIYIAVFITGDVGAAALVIFSILTKCGSPNYFCIAINKNTSIICTGSNSKRVLDL